MSTVRLPRAYGWQTDALAAWSSGGRCGIVEAVTGTGKTNVGITAIAEALDSGRRAAVLVPGIELQRQWTRSLQAALRLGPQIGHRGGGGKATLRTHKVVVSVVHSAVDCSLSPPPGALLVGDECHRYAAETFRLALDDRFEQRLGLTATLERPDHLEQVVVDYFGDTVFRMGYEQAIADEVTAHFTVALVGVDMSLPERMEYERLTRTIRDYVKVLVRDYGFTLSPFHRFMRAVKKAAEDRSDPACRTARAFQAALGERKLLMARSPAKRKAVARLSGAVARSDRALIFTEAIDTAEGVADDLRARDLTVGTIHSELRPPQRREVLRAFESGRLKAIAAPKVLDEGIDVPAADLAVIVAASKTRRQMIQRMGRILRRKTDDRLARFAILYLRGTTEDLAAGAHEAFLNEIVGVAEDVRDFSARTDLDAAIGFLSARTPATKPRLPRYEGEPAREPLRSVTPDDDFSVTEFLGIDPIEFESTVTISGRDNGPATGAHRQESPEEEVARRVRRRLLAAGTGSGDEQEFDRLRRRVVANARRELERSPRWRHLRAEYFSHEGTLDLTGFHAWLPEWMSMYDDEVLLPAILASPDVAEIGRIAHERQAELHGDTSTEPASAADDDPPASPPPAAPAPSPVPPPEIQPARNRQPVQAPRSVVVFIESLPAERRRYAIRFTAHVLNGAALPVAPNAKWPKKVRQRIRALTGTGAAPGVQTQPQQPGPRRPARVSSAAPTGPTKRRPAASRGARFGVTASVSTIRLCAQCRVNEAHCDCT